MHESMNIILDLVLPAGITKYFEVVNHTMDSTSINLFLDELNLVPEEFENDKLESKGFYDSVTIQDFPLRFFSAIDQLRRAIKFYLKNPILQSKWIYLPVLLFQ